MTSLSSPPELFTILDEKLKDLASFISENEANLIREAQCVTLLSTHQSILKSLVGKKNADEPSGRKRRQQNLFKLKTVEPSKRLQGIITTWTNNYDSFFQDHEPVSPKNYYNFAASFVRVGCNEAKREVATIQRRFDLASIYNRVVKWKYHNGKQWLRGKSTYLAQHLKQSLTIPDDVEEVKAKVERYVDQGASFHRWAERLGGSGYFILLPQTVAEGLYERRQNRRDIPDLIAKLDSLGIRKTAVKWKVLDLGNYISRRLNDEADQWPSVTGVNICESATEGLPGGLQASRLETPHRPPDLPGDISMGSLQSAARAVLQPDLDHSLAAQVLTQLSTPSNQHDNIPTIQGAIQCSAASPGVPQTFSAGQPSQDYVDQYHAIDYASSYEQTQLERNANSYEQMQLKEYANSYGQTQLEENANSYGQTHLEEYANSYEQVQLEEYANSYGQISHEGYPNPCVMPQRLYRELSTSYGDRQEHYDHSITNKITLLQPQPLSLGLELQM